ncbi:MAG: response regulator [Myxococcales bacterium]|nr:MAG: response regulator [Myxococcales bacterium]
MLKTIWAPLVPQHRPLFTGLKVLLVEDHDQVRQSLVTLLQASGMTVLAATCVLEALDLFQAGAPQLIISDQGLPDGDGCGFIRKVRALGSQGIPALAVSAFFSPQAQTQALRAGFDACLAKHDFDRLLDVLEELLERSTGSACPRVANGGRN